MNPNVAHVATNAIAATTVREADASSVDSRLV
jgi:hypothetical protein